MKLCILICLLLIAVDGDDYEEDSNYYDLPEISLVSTPDDQYLSEQFEMIARRMGYYVYTYNIHENEVNETIEKSQKHSHVINLHVSVKELYNDSDTINKFLHSNLLCAIDCDYDNVTYEYTQTRLISERILHEPRLFQLLETVFDKEFEEDFIQICLPPNIPKIPLHLFTENMRWPVHIQVDNCEGDIAYNKAMIAVISDGPLKTDSKLPTIFYQTPYTFPEVKDRYPNSVNFSPTWQPLKYAFKEFFRHMKWYRVAILSDDTEYSLDFLEELIPLFQQEGIVYTDQKCINRTCDFDPPLNLLSKNDARIIILNIDKRNSKELLDSVSRIDLWAVTWVVRDWPFEAGTSIPGASNIFSLSLSADFKEDYKWYPHLSSIRDGIQKIDSLYKAYLGDKEKFQRFFTRYTMLMTPFKTIAYIMRMSNENPTLISSMTVKYDGTISWNQFTNIYQKLVIPDSTKQCVVKSRNFFKPCDHEKLLLVLGVWVILSLSFLVFIVIFNWYRKSRYYNRFT